MAFDELIDEMMDELRGAEKYADEALSSSKSELLTKYNKTLGEMASQELGHYNNLLAMARVVEGDQEKIVLDYLCPKFTKWKERIQFKISQIK